MARSLNKVQLIGNLTRDPEVRQTPNGQSVANIGIATNRQWRERETGVQREEVEFHNIVFWGPQAEIVQKYLKKGDKLFVEGRLRTRSWEAQDGSKRQTTEIVGEEMIMLGSNPNSGNFTPKSAPATPAAAPTAKKEELPVISMDDEPKSDVKVEDLPF